VLTIGISPAFVAVSGFLPASVQRLQQQFAVIALSFLRALTGSSW
jgi:hypothetical protein